MHKLERLRELLAHQNFDGNYTQLIDLMADLALKKLEPKQQLLPALEKPSSTQNQKRTRYLPIAVRRIVWTRDGGQCTYRDSFTGRRCSARHAVQFDHATPFA